MVAVETSAHVDTRPGDPSELQGGSQQEPGFGLKTALISQQGYQPSPHVIEWFMKFSGNPAQAWTSAGMPLEKINLKRRLLHNYRMIMFGGPNILADLLDSLAGWAGHDRLARKDAKEVMTHLRVIPGADAAIGHAAEIAGGK